MRAKLTGPSDNGTLRLFRGSEQLVERPVTLPAPEGMRIEDWAEAATRALFGPDIEDTARRIAPTMGAHASLLGITVRLSVESDDLALLAWPWRRLSCHHQSLEREWSWSFSIAQPGMRAEPVEAQFPAGVLILAAEQTAHTRAMAERLIHAQPSLQGAVEVITTCSQVFTAVPDLRPQFVYFVGALDAEHGVVLADGSLSAVDFRRVLPAGLEPKLLYLNHFATAAAGIEHAQRWSPKFPYVLTNLQPRPRADAERTAEEVMARIFSGHEPAQAVREAALEVSRAGIDATQCPTVLDRAAQWRSRGRARAEARTLDEVLHRLDRVDQRTMAVGSVLQLVRQTVANVRAKAFLYFGRPKDQPEALGEGLFDHVRALIDDVDIVRIDVPGLPEASDPTTVQTVLEGIRVGLDVPDHAAIGTALTAHHRRRRRRATVIWADWGCYPGEGRDRSPEECIAWLAAEADALDRAYPNQPGLYWVSTLGLVSEEPERIEATFAARIQDFGLYGGSYGVEVLPALGAVTVRHVVELLHEHADVFGTAELAQRAAAAAAILGGKRDRPYDEVVRELRRLHHIGPRNFIASHK